MVRVKVGRPKEVFLFLFTTLLAAALAGLPAAQPNPLSVEGFLARFTETWNTHDANRIARLFEEDGDYRDPYGSYAVGRGPIADLLVRDFERLRRLATWVPARSVIRYLREDLVLVDWQVAVRNQISRRQRDDVDLDVTLILVRRGESWSISAARESAPEKAPTR